jgi:phosphoribosylanthranilate isomerase
MQKTLKIKVCGMRDPMNIDALAALKPNYIGFIFYPPSKRYVRDITDGQALDFIPKSIKRTGVFVNAASQEITNAMKAYQLSAVQLHGDEPPEFCQSIKQTGVEVLKAFPIDGEFDFESLKRYMDVCDYFLFDTKTHKYGGSGKKFGWGILDGYLLNKPFMLSGGIGPDDASAILAIQNDKLYGIDINSRFEDAPGMKNIALIGKFLNELKNNNIHE